jgi:hypothetical protein
MATMMQKINDTGRESTHQIGHEAWRSHHITLRTHHKSNRQNCCVMYVDNAKVAVDDFLGWAKSEDVDLDSEDPQFLKLYFEIEPEQARRLGEALIAHADYASTGTEDGE